MRKRGSVWLANLNPGRGTESGKIRPVLIVQSQALLDAEHPFTLVVPMTSLLIDAAEPLRLRLSAQAGFDNDSDLLFDQVRAIDNKRLLEGPLSQCSPEFMGRADEALREVLDLLSV